MDMVQLENSNNEAETLQFGSENDDQSSTTASDRAVDLDAGRRHRQQQMQRHFRTRVDKGTENGSAGLADGSQRVQGPVLHQRRRSILPQRHQDRCAAAQLLWRSQGLNQFTKSS